jgi:glycosyltransferase involved in cell wall biosynthesis
MNKSPPARELLGPGRSDGAWSRAKIRVLHVISGLGPGGAETVLFRLATQAGETRHEVICLSPPDWYSDRLEERGIRVHHVNFSNPLLALAGALRFHRMVKASRADVVQGWMYRGNFFGGLSGRIAGIPVVWNIRCSNFNLLPPATRALARLGGLFARWIPKVVINCSEISTELHALIGYDSAEGLVIPNGYDPDAFRPDEERRNSIRHSLGIDPDEFVAGAIGRWDPQKGYPVLIKALSLLRDRGAPVRLLLVGRGLDASNRQLARIIDETGCAEFVQPIGHRTDVADIARALDLHVLSSLTEGFPNVVAETMLSGTPNVATYAGDSPIIVGETGWMVPPGNPKRIADAIQEAHAEWGEAPRQWQARREAARRRIIENFTIGRMVRAYEEVWTRIASKPDSNQRIAPQAPAPPPTPKQGTKKPLRILHIINNLGLGGAETLLYRLAASDSANEHIVVSLSSPSWYSSRLREDGVELHHLDLDSLAAIPPAMLRLKNIIRRSDADVVQCWMYRSNVFGGLLARLSGKPVVWGVHNSSYEPLRPSARALVHFSRFVVSWTPDFIINCSTESARLHAKLGYSAVDGAIVHNGYDPAAFYPDESSRKTTRKALGLGTEEFAVGTIARWDRLKDIPNLLAALRLAHDRVPFRSFLIGWRLTADNSDLQREIERAGCGDSVTLLGMRKDIQDVARALDVHVLGSRTEAFPNVVAETMLSGTPNVVTDVGDCAMMVGGTGWIAPPRDPEQLADAIVRAYDEWKGGRRHWAQRRKAARKQIVDNYSMNRMAEAYVEIWRRVARAQPDGTAGLPSSKS